MRLDQVLSQASGGRGRDQVPVKVSRAAIEQGRVEVTGVVVMQPSHQVLLGMEEITLDGAIVDTTLIFHRLLLFNKPSGAVSTGADASEDSIFRLLPEEQQHSTLSFYGRLDRDTTGLMLLGTDGGIGHLLTSPDNHVPKEYWALLKASHQLTEDAVEVFAAGLQLSDGTVCRPATLERRPQGCDGPPGSGLRAVPDTFPPCRLCQERSHWARDCPNNGTSCVGVETCVRLTIHEGANHQVKRMLAQCNGNVVRLHREAIGPLVLSELSTPIPTGSARAPDADEMRLILALLQRPGTCRDANARYQQVKCRRAHAPEAVTYLGTLPHGAHEEILGL